MRKRVYIYFSLDTSHWRKCPECCRALKRLLDHYRGASEVERSHNLETDYFLVHREHEKDEKEPHHERGSRTHFKPLHFFLPFLSLLSHWTQHGSCFLSSTNLKKTKKKKKNMHTHTPCCTSSFLPLSRRGRVVGAVGQFSILDVRPQIETQACG